MSDDESITATKTCRKCKIEKPTTEYGRNKYSKDRLQYECKSCLCERSKQYVESNKEAVSQRKAEYRKSNKENIYEYNKLYSQKNEDRLKEKRKIAYHEHKEENKERKSLKDKAYRERYRAEISDRRKAKLQGAAREKNISRAKSWYLKNKEYALGKAKNSYLAKREYIINRVREYEKMHPEKTRLHSRVKSSRRRARLRTAGGYYTVADIERIFELQKARCANCRCSIVSKYHIDHRIPVAKGGDNNPGNIDLLCPACNLKKSAKLPHEFAQENGRLI